MNQTYLKSTPMLNYDAPAIQALIHTRNWEALDEHHKIEAAYDFVQNEILFGYNRSDLLTAEEVLQDGCGQCNTKATLLMALLRGLGIPCRLHGTEVSKYFQRGATNALINALAPETITHTWAEVLYNGQWLTLEGVITDKAYVQAVKKQYPNVTGPFQKYAIAVPDLQTLDVSWRGEPTFVQREALVKDYGTWDSPDAFFAVHPQTWSKLKNFAYVHLGRKMMNTNVTRMRRRG